METVDKLGARDCTDSVYATMGTIYMTRADETAATDKAAAAALYKSAARYNRAFANAVMCRAEKRCDAAQAFWAQK